MYETAYSYFINPATKQFCITTEGHAAITQLPVFYYGDRPKFTLSFPANTLGEGDSIIAVLDNENRFLDTRQATGLNPVMCGVIHEVTAEEATNGTIEVTPFNFSKKFADVVNGHDEPVTCLFTIYQKSVDEHDNFTFLELGQTLANANPTTTSPELIFDDLPISKYYTREELDAVYQQFLDGVALVIQLSKLAESYAVGGTGTREGENTDNAKYYAEMAQQAAQAVTTMYGEIQTLATQVANTKEYIDGLVVSIATDIRDISAIAASVTEKASQVSHDAQYVRQAKSSIDASVLFVTNAKSTIENLATQVSQNAVNVANDKDAVQQLASQVTNAANQVAHDKADAKGYAEAAANTLTSVQAIQTDVTQKQSAITTMKNTIQSWYTQIQSWYNSIQAYAEQMLGWYTDIDTWQQQVSADKAIVVSAKDTAVQAKDDAVSAKTAAETAQEKAETAQEKAEDAQEAAEQARDEAVSTLANKRDILQTLVSSSSTSLEVEAGKSYKWTVSAASTISMAAADKVANKETRIDIYIDLQDGGSVTGSGVVIADSVLQSGWYKLIWDGTNATLYSTKAGGAESYITIPASTTAYSLQDNKHYQQVPSVVPTYTLPAVTMDGLVHEITVLVDFINVTSCSFVDASNVPVTLQSAISPQIGEAYIFRCYWYGKWRVVPLKIRNAATATSSNGVLEVSDAVAGDALALKMTAPRSVVVNQLVKNGDFSDGMTGWRKSTYYMASVSDNVAEFTLVNNGIMDCPVTQYRTFIAGHVVLVKYDWKLTVAQQFESERIYYTGYFGTPTQWFGTVSVTGSTDWNTVAVKKTLSGTTTEIHLGLYRQQAALQIPDGSVVSIKNVMVVDLTQYFNGDQTLIDSIQSWDDLVAYDPRFASYVEYNTGEVAGVQPQVKVTGKNLFDQNANLTNGYLRSWGLNVGDSGWTISDYIPVRQGMLITSSYPSGGGNNPSICFYDKDKQFISGIAHGNGPTYKTYTVPSGCCFVRDSFKDSDLNTFQLELGSSPTSYEPYHDGGTAQAPAPLFAVGNAADEYEAVAGVTTRETYTIPSANYNTLAINIGMAPNENGFMRVIITTNPDNAYGITNVISNVFVNKRDTVTGNETFECIAGHPNYRSVYLNMRANRLTGDLTTSSGRVAAFREWANASGLVIAYKLATPTTSQSTPTQISLQAGSNVAMQTDGGRTLQELAMTYENLPAAE